MKVRKPIQNFEVDLFFSLHLTLANSWRTNHGKSNEGGHAKLTIDFLANQP